MGEKKMDGFPTRAQALEDFFAAWEPQCGYELVTLDEACGRVLAEDVESLVTVPVVRASACDGIAVRSADFADGLPDTSSWRLGVEFVRADTGDDFPDEYDAVVMIEKAAIQEDGSVVLDDDVQVEPGTNTMRAGSTVRAGKPILKAGALIRPTDLAALCMGGLSAVKVRKRPVVAFIPTGSELVSFGMRPQRGQVVDANSLMCKGMLESYGARVVKYPIVRDDPAALEAAFERALETSDLVVVNGGSAVGEEDFNVRMIEKRGRVVHHYVAAAPGRPIMMAVVDGKPVVDLPGPPMAAYYGTDWCLQAVVCRMLGVPMPQRQTVRAVTDEAYRTFGGFDLLGRWDVRKTADGLVAHPYNFKRGEQVECLTSNAHRVSPIGEWGVEEGEEIELELIRGAEWLEERQL